MDQVTQQQVQKIHQTNKVVQLLLLCSHSEGGFSDKEVIQIVSSVVSVNLSNYSTTFAPQAFSKLCFSRCKLSVFVTNVMVIVCFELLETSLNSNIRENKD